MSKSQVTTPMAALAATAGEAVVREQAALSAWAELMQAARVTADEQDVDLRYVAVLDQPGMPDMSHVIGQLETDVYTGEVAERLVAIKRGAIERGRPHRGRVDLEHEGCLRSFEVTATPRRNERGEIMGVLSVAVDLTDTLRLQNQALQSHTLEGIGRLAGGVAHDFNNLLTVILGYCELLRMRQRGSTELDEINNAARRASQLTRQLLAFSRRQVLHVETLDLNGLIRGLNRMLRRITGEDIAFTTDLADEFLWVVADVGQMEQVLLNLVGNARDAMPSGGALRLATRVDPTMHAGSLARPWVELVVQDTGVGMTEDVRSRIFEPFFTTKGDAGAGLGLATAYGIVTQTGGEIECESAPGAGTTFRVRLPLAQVPAVSSAATMARQSEHGHETVLVVEDEPLVRELAGRALREYGYTVLEAQDADGALRFIDLPNLAIVVSDMVVPGRTGDDLSAELARRRPGLPVLLMTGDSDALQQRPVDPAHLLRKPFTPTDLVAKIRFLLDRAPTPGS